MKERSNRGRIRSVDDSVSDLLRWSLGSEEPEAGRGSSFSRYFSEYLNFRFLLSVKRLNESDGIGMWRKRLRAQCILCCCDVLGYWQEVGLVREEEGFILSCLTPFCFFLSRSPACACMCPPFCWQRSSLKIRSARRLDQFSLQFLESRRVIES